MLCCSDGQPLASIALNDLLQLDHLRLPAEAFKEQASAPCRSAPIRGAANLCLLQGEAATVDASQLPGLLIGSQDATTCLVVILWCPLSSQAWAAHVDQCLSSGDMTLLNDSLQRMQQPTLYISGGYCDQKNLGLSLAQNILQQFHSLSYSIRLQLLCAGSINTAADGSPCVCQLVLDTAEGLVHPWMFDDRGPEVPRRFAAHYCRYNSSCNLVNIWCQEHQQLILQSFDPTIISSWGIMRFEQMLEWPDEQLLAVMSTSPLHEPSWFCEDMRQKMQFLINAQEPESAERAAATSVCRYRWCSSTHSWKTAEVLAAPTTALALA